MKPFLGHYVLGCGFGINWANYCRAIKQEGTFGGTVLHIFTPWSGINKPPWSLFPAPKLKDSRKYDLNAIDQTWEDMLYEGIYQHARRGLKVQLCLFDSYADWKKPYYTAPNGNLISRHPWRNNNSGWTADAMALFANKPWMQWIDWMPHEKDPSTYKVIGKHGAWIQLYVDAVAGMIVRVRKTIRPKYKPFIRTFNEERQKAGTQTGGTGDESKIDLWVQHRFKQAGLVAGKDYIMTNDYLPWTQFKGAPPFEEDYVPAWGEWKVARQYINNRLKGLHEIHSVNGKATVQEFKRLGGATAGNAWYSMDGVKEDGQYFRKAKELIALNRAGQANFCDVKFWGPKWHPTDMQASFDDNWDWFIKQL